MPKLLKKFEGLLKYFLAAVLIAVPLYPKFPFIRIPGTYVSVRLEDFLLLALTVIFATIFFKELPKLLKNRLEFSVGVFIFVGLVSLISGIFLTQTVPPLLGTLNWLRRIEYFVPFVMGLLYFKRYGGEDLEFFLKVIMAVILVAFIYGLGQKYLTWPVIITQNEEYAKGVALRWIPGSHINSTFAGHYDLATFLVFFLPFAISQLFLLKGFWTKLALSGVVGAGLWLLANAVSRISIVSYLLAAVVTLLLIKKYKAIFMVLLVSLIFFILSGTLLSRYRQIISVIFAAEESSFPQRINQTNISKQTISVFEDRSMSIRLNVEWPRALRAFAKNPVLGTGYTSITLATDNDFLRLLGEVGLLGFLAFTFVLINLGSLIRRILAKLGSLPAVEQGFIAAYTGGLMGVLLNSLFIDIFEASKFAIVFWLITGMFVALVRKHIYAENN